MSLPMFFLFLVTCLTAGTTGAVFKPGAWYDSLAKPRWTPPNWFFPLAWASIYLFMSVAAARVAGLAGTVPEVGFALGLWGLQIAFNTLWTPIFFGLRRLGGGMIVLTGLWLTVLATCIAFWRIDWVAGLLFVPYVAWVSTAGALNFSVWRLNPHNTALEM